MKVGLWLLSIALVCAVGFFLASRPSPTELAQPVRSSPSVPFQSPSPPPILNPATPPRASRTSVPVLEQIREEVERDPHTLPPSFTGLIEEIARQKRAALQDSSHSEELAEHLERVVQLSDYPPARAYALRIFREMTDRDSRYQLRYRRLEDGLPPSIIELSKK